MELYALFVAFVVAPDVDRLGADDWATREAATARLSAPALRWLVPAPDSSPNPEVRERLRVIRSGFRWWDPESLECRAFHRNFPAWVELYLKENRTRLTPAELFARLFNQPARLKVLFTIMPTANGNESFLNLPPTPGDYPRFLAYLGGHWRRGSK